LKSAGSRFFGIVGLHLIILFLMHDLAGIFCHGGDYMNRSHKTE